MKVFAFDLHKLLPPSTAGKASLPVRADRPVAEAGAGDRDSLLLWADEHGETQVVIPATTA